MQLESVHKARITELQNFYKLQVAAVEADRYQTLLSCQAPAHVLDTSITLYYDSQRHLLMDRVERSLALLQGQTVNTSAPGGQTQQRRRVKKRQFCSSTLKVLNAWYDCNRDYPYLSQDSAERLAQSAGVSVEQVKKWLSNRRMRAGNTMTLTEIARKRKHTVDDLLFADDCKRQKWTWMNSSYCVNICKYSHINIFFRVYLQIFMKVNIFMKFIYCVFILVSQFSQNHVTLVHCYQETLHKYIWNN